MGRDRCRWALLIPLAVLWAVRAAPASVAWEEPQRVSASDGRSAWFPTLAVDSTGRAHLLWSDTSHGPRSEPSRIKGDRADQEQLAYAVRDGDGWSEPRLVAIPQQPIYRQSLAVDAHDRLHLLFRYCPGGGLDVYYRQAPAAEGFTAGDWGRAPLLNFRWNTYSPDLAVQGDTLHMLFDDIGTLDGQCHVCADIYYRRSRDGGETWSAPVSLRPSVSGSARAHIFADAAGVLHATWDEGWDRQSGRGKAESGVYMLSADGGETWSEPTVVTWPGNSNALLTAGSDGRGGVLLVWRTVESAHPQIYFQWSKDWGATWSEPAAIPGIRARDWASPFDRYSMATDGAGRIHLLVGGVAPAHTAAALYHLEWDGAEWSTPDAVYSGDWIPEYPQVVIDAAGVAHASWYVRKDPFGERVPHQVWYARGRVADAPPPRALEAPLIARVMVPPPTPIDLWPKPTPPPGLVLDNEKLSVLGLCLGVGFLVTVVVDLVVRRRNRGLHGAGGLHGSDP